MPGAEPVASEGCGERARTGVLLCHGITATPQMVRPVADRLAAQGYAVRAPLLPGHGTSWQQMSRTRYRDWLGAVEAAAEELRRGRDTVLALGVSLGGALVTDLAHGRPDLVDGLVLVNPAFAASDPRLKVLPVLKHVLPRLRGIADDIAREGPPRELAYAWTPLKPLHSFVEQWPRITAALPTVTVPVLLLRSRHDHVVPALSGDLFLERVGSRDVREAWLERSAHVATLDHDADLLIEQTLDFVAEVGGR